MKLPTKLIIFQEGFRFDSFRFAQACSPGLGSSNHGYSDLEWREEETLSYCGWHCWLFRDLLGEDY